MLPAALALVALGGVSFALLASGLLQSTFSGSVDVVLLGGTVGSVSIETALMLTIAATACVGLGALGVLMLRRTEEPDQPEITEDRSDVDATELEARAHLLEYRIQLLSEQVARLAERKDELVASGERAAVSASVVAEPTVVIDRAPAATPQSPARPTTPLERMRLVLVPSAAPAAIADGHVPV